MSAVVRRSVPGSVVLLWLVALAGAAAAAPSDEFIRGYAAAVLAERFGRPAASVRVQDGVVTAVVEGLSEAERSALQEALARVPGVAGIELRAAPAGPGSPPVTGRKPDDGGPGPAEPTWRTGLMPGGLLFRPLIADPRWPHFSAALQRYLDDPDFRHVASVSFGETFAVYRAALGRGWWEAGIQAAVFSIFDLDADSTDLINADYFVAGVLGYRLGGFSALGRLFHQSSHLGDEFLLRRSRVERINLSYEGVDGKVSYEAFGDVLRLYAGAGYLIRREPDTVDPWSLQYGVEFRSPWPGRGAAFRPIAAADVQYREANDFSADLSIRAGVQFAGVLASRDVQLLLEYFNGRSPNGQFYRRKIDYLGIGVHFHF